jgi:hypothetical protein
VRALAKLSQGERIVLIGGLLLIIDVLVLPWHSIDLADLDLGDLDIVFDPTRTGVQEPNAAYGVVAVVLASVMVLQIVIARLTPVLLPGPRVLWAQVHLIAGVFVAVVLVVKLFRETEWLGYGAYSGVLGGVLVAYGGYRIAQETGTPA